MKDYSDLISPILVKEFRQGIRSKLFTFTFLLSQFVMVLIVITGLALDGMNQKDFNILFWIIVILPIMFLLPLSGINSISEEVKLKTIDLIYLTHLGSFRILLGKMLSICFQILLLLSAVLPYVIVRYYIGNVNLYEDLVFLVNAFLIATLVTSLSIFLSTVKLNPILKWILLLFILYSVIGSISVLSFGPASRSGMGFMSVGFIIYIYLFWALTITLILEFGAKLIAPEIENHSTSIRLIGIAFVLIAFSSTIFLSSKSEKEFIFATTMVIIGLISFVSCCEKMKTSPLVYLPFVRYKRSGRLLGKLLYPGWITGIIYTVFLTASFITICLSTGLMPMDIFDDLSAPIVISFISTAVYAPIVLKVFGDRIKRVITFSFLVHLISAIPFYFFSIGHGMGKSWSSTAAQVCAFFPNSYFLCNLTPFNKINTVFQIVGFAVSLGFIAFFLKDIIFSYYKMKAIEFKAIQILKEKNAQSLNEVS